MIKQYIQDIITVDEIDKWQSGNRILICSQTGSGKSEFIKNNLYEYCKSKDKRILLMSNRNLLKNQNLIDIEGKTDHIEAHNYQEFESKILNGLYINKLFGSFDYIVYDESHYFFSDSQFNRNTDLLIDPIKETPFDKVFIFITATPDALLDYQPNYDFTYDLKHDYSYIENIYFYNRSNIAESILQNVPYDEKAIYFGSKAQDTWDLSTKFLDSSFICSKDNALRGKSNLNTINQIVEKSMFESRILFATKLLDNGTNIKDSSVKHIVIDMLDPISFEQCLGRKRCFNENDTINLYIKNYHGGNLYYVIKKFNEKIKIVNEFNEMSEIDFKRKYRKTDFEEIIDNDYQLNKAKYQNYLTQRRLLGRMITDSDKMGYKKYICNMLGFDINKIKSGDEEFEKISIRQLLKRNVGKKMFKEDQDKFKILFFDNIFTPKRTDYIARGIKAANGILEEDKLKFRIYSMQETRGVNRNKTYWIIEKK